MTDLTPHWNRVVLLEAVADAARELLDAEDGGENMFDRLAISLHELDKARPRSAQPS